MSASLRNGAGSCRSSGLKSAPQRQRWPEQIGPRQQPVQAGAQQTLAARTLIGRLDMGTADIDQMHVMHARGTGRHAGETGEATVDMERRILVGRLLILQHVLDEIDAAAR